MQDREQHDDATDLEKLAAELDGRAYVISLVAGDGRRARLHITSRQAARLVEYVYADAESFWWGWAERIGPVADVAGAALAINNVLRFCGTR
ncbi:MAG TPA: hypothetical protein VGL63_09995 [Streptosporangiaceae bacterium]|jgi:hypothetical protein